MRRLLRRAGAAIALLLVALLLGAVPSRNIGFAQASGDDAVAIRVSASLAHSELIVPVAAAGHDWRGTIGAGGFADGRAPATHLSFSWGERDFFLATPTWADFDWRLALRALFASQASLMHVYRLDLPPERWAPDGVTIYLSPEQYRRLAAGIAAELGRPLVRVPGYGGDDVFYEAVSRYGVWHNCNQWAADRLAGAGVRVGRWTPVAPSLMTPLVWQFAGDGR